MATGGVFVNVKRTGDDDYTVMDISEQIIAFLHEYYDYDLENARELVEWNERSEEEEEFIEEIKNAYLGSGLLGEGYVVE